MIANKEDREDIEIDNLGFEDTAVDMTIDASKMDAIYEMFSTNLYKEPIPSIVRELVSNAFDAQKANGSIKPVVVSGGYEEGTFFIYFIDSGEGISPERWKNTLAKFLESTKKESNDYHGFWGLGSKSPFSYTDLYYFQTVYEGIEYLYIMFKNDVGKPKGDLISSKSTDKPNGTTVKFSIGKWGHRNYEDGDYNRPADYNKFEDAITTQLAYFDNVYVKNFSFNNAYTIYEGKTYKYRLDTEESEMHLILGKVRYPIDWKALGIPRINIPVAVKFNIGELMVIPSREDLKYTVETKDKLKKGIDTCLKELSTKVNSGYTTIEEVFTELKRETRTIQVAEGVNIPLSPGNYGQSANGERIKYPFFVPKPTLKEFVGLPITIPDNPYNIFRVKSIIKNGRIQEKDGHEAINLWAYTHPDNANTTFLPLFRTAKFVSDKYKNYAISDAYLVTKRAVGLKFIGKSFGIWNVAPSGFRRDRKIVGEPLIGDLPHGIKNKTQLVLYYRKVITAKFVEKTQSYDKYDVHSSKMLEYEAKFRKPKRNFNKDKGELFVTYGYDLNLPKQKVTIKELTSKRSIIVYGDNSQKPILKAIHTLLYSYFKYTSSRKVLSFLVVMINKTDLKVMEELNESRKEKYEGIPNILAYNTEQFISNNKVFRKEATKVLAEPILNKVRIPQCIAEVSPEIASISLFRNKYTTTSDVDKLMSSPLGVELLSIINQGKLYDQSIIDASLVMKDISKDLFIFNKFEKGYYSEEEKIEIAKLIQAKGYEVDPYLVFEPTKEEDKWMSEWIELANYYKIVQQMFYYKTDVEDDNGISFKVEGESYKYHLINKQIINKLWESYRRLKKPNRLGKTLSLLLQEKNL